MRHRLFHIAFAALLTLSVTTYLWEKFSLDQKMVAELELSEEKEKVGESEFFKIKHLSGGGEYLAPSSPTFPLLGIFRTKVAEAQTLRAFTCPTRLYLRFSQLRICG